jgi:hypothetical protein
MRRTAPGEEAAGIVRIHKHRWPDQLSCREEARDTSEDRGWRSLPPRRLR